MKIIDAKAELMIRGGAERTRAEWLADIETAARTCYRSEDLAKAGSAERLVKALVRSGHWAMIEHASATVRFAADIGVCREITRHRVASFAQESTRYCNYGHGKFDKEITVIRPCWMEKDSEEYHAWECTCMTAQLGYFRILELTGKPELARDVLPLSTASVLTMTANLREWKHFFDLRADGTTGTPHPQMVEIAKPLQRQFQEILPEVFGEPEQ